MIKSSTLKILLAFSIWRIALFIVAILATWAIPTFGNRFPYWDTILSPTGFPSWLWGFGNFDGVHYLRLALYGYEGSQYSQAFFPLYPVLIKLLGFGSSYFLSALFLSNLLFIAGIYIFYKLLKLDFPAEISFSTVLLLLVFPTSFYFGSIYSEALFFFLIVSCLYLLRKERYLEAGFLGAFASSTRIVGLLLVPLLLIEIYQGLKKGEFVWRSEKFIKFLLAAVVAPLGTFIYMWYLKSGFGDPVYFLSAQPAFGAERSSQPFILLPQVIFRYLKMITTVPVNSWQFFSSALEVTFTLGAVIVLIMSFKRTRFSYWVFAAGCLLIPTLTGTLSSMPRYVLMVFLLFPSIVLLMGKYFKLFAVLLVILQIILVSLFIRGYWIA